MSAEADGSQPAPIAVGIVHASRLIRDGLRDLLGQQGEVRVAGSFGDAAQVLAAPVPGPHVLLYDLSTGRQDGPSQLMELHHRLPQAKILMFNVIDDDAAVRTGFEAKSSAVGPFVGDGYRHDGAAERGKQCGAWAPSAMTASEGVAGLSHVSSARCNPLPQTGGG